MRQRREQGRKKCLLWCMRVGEKCYQTHCSGSTTCAQEKRRQAEKHSNPKIKCPVPGVCGWMHACVHFQRERGFQRGSHGSIEGSIKHLHRKREVKRERGERAFLFTDTNALCNEEGEGRRKPAHNNVMWAAAQTTTSPPTALPTEGK